MSTEDAKLKSIIAAARRAGRPPAFSYDRISAEVQTDGVSLAFQEHYAAAYAKASRLTLVSAFQMVESAHREGRRVFNQMLDLAVELGVHDLIFKNVDRMSRNYHDLVRIDSLIDRHGFRVHFYQTGLIVHADSSYNDRFLIGIQLAVSRHTSDKISQDVREANRFKAEQGTAPFPSPFGYHYDRDQKRHLVDPNNEALCHTIFDQYDDNEISLDDLADWLNARGYKTAKGKPGEKAICITYFRIRFITGSLDTVIGCGQGITSHTMIGHATKRASNGRAIGFPGDANARTQTCSADFYSANADGP